MPVKAVRDFVDQCGQIGGAFDDTVSAGPRPSCCTIIKTGSSNQVAKAHICENVIYMLGQWSINLPDVRPHMYRQAAKDVDHVNLRSSSIPVAAHDPRLTTIIVVNVEDGKVRGVQVVLVSNILASLGNPARSPVVPCRMSGMEVVSEVILQLISRNRRRDLRLVWVASKCMACANRCGQ